MWALVVGGVIVTATLVGWYRSGQTLLDYLEVRLVRLFARVWHRCQRVGPDPLPAQGPALVVANHPSQADPAFLVASSARPLHFLQAREYFDVFLLRRLFRRVGCIPVARDGHDVAGVRQALRHLNRGAVVAVFPEGEVNPSAILGPCKSGAALVALRSRAPVFPALIRGGPRADSVLGPWLRPSSGVCVRFGPAVDLASYHGRAIDREVLSEVTAILKLAITDLDPAAASGNPARMSRTLTA